MDPLKAKIRFWGGGLRVGVAAPPPIIQSAELLLKLIIQVYHDRSLGACRQRYMVKICGLLR